MKLNIEDLHKHISDFYNTHEDEKYLDAYDSFDAEGMFDVIERFHDISDCCVCRAFFGESR